MSKIGRKAIDLQQVQVDIDGLTVKFKGKKAAGEHELPAPLKASIADKKLLITCEDINPDSKRLWGLHRALLANKIKGANDGFEQKLIINGLGFKGTLSGSKINFRLGYTNEINFELPAGITVDIDKSGQQLVIKGSDKKLVGDVADQIRALRPPEPYKGTGIKLDQEVVRRKAGKTKA
jgi:large subunit ribosomal protein L6